MHGRLLPRHPLLLSLQIVAAALTAPTQALAQDWSAQLRARSEHRGANLQGPLAGPQGSTQGLDAELRGQWRGLNAALALRQEQGGEAEEKRSSSSATLNELYANADLGAWQLSAGRKLLSWDVGYAFRPNDMVAQEERRTLLSSQVRGRPLLAAEHFDADTAWSLVWVNPLKQEGRRGDEQALAGRVYQRLGSLDLHGFARWGQHSGPSLGAALAWVATDSQELHASLRLARRDHALLLNQPDASSLLQRQSPWREGLRGSHAQALLGLSWTGENRLSLLAEAWWDGNALSPQDWRDWQRRTQQLRALPPGAAVPPQALAANLAWQAQAFGSGSSLQRSNVFLRLSWSEDGWSPALDCLYHPADGGRIWTASLTWQGDRLRADAGLRHYGGPAGAVLAQLPQRRQGYAALSWAF